MSSPFKLEEVVEPKTFFVFLIFDLRFHRWRVLSLLSSKPPFRKTTHRFYQKYSSFTYHPNTYDTSYKYGAGYPRGLG
jgi:hypothetical protein